MSKRKATNKEQRLLLFNWQDRMFCDFVLGLDEWERLKTQQPSLVLPRKKHPPLTLSWQEFQDCLQVRDDQHAQAFLIAYDGLRLVGTVDLLEILNGV